MIGKTVRYRKVWTRAHIFIKLRQKTCGIVILTSVYKIADTVVHNIVSDTRLGLRKTQVKLLEIQFYIGKVLTCGSRKGCSHFWLSENYFRSRLESTDHLGKIDFISIAE